MNFTDRKGNLYEGRRLTRGYDNLQEVMGWLVEYGLPRLIDPKPAMEFDRSRMTTIHGQKYGPGVYVDTKKGVLVIRSRYKHTFEADVGDWVFRDVINNHFFVVKQLSIDNGTYTVLEQE